MLAFLFNINLMELAIIAGGAVIVFGKDLPQVVMRAVAQFMRLRNSVTRMWRDAGLEDELRKVRWEIEREARLKAPVTQPAIAPPVHTPRPTTLVEEDAELVEEAELAEADGAASHDADPPADPFLGPDAEPDREVN